MKPKFGDLVVFNYSNQNFDIIPKDRCGKEDDKAIVGIVVQVNNDMTVDVLMKNYLTSESLLIPYRYMEKPTFISAYLKDMFDRYCNKYQRTSVIDLTTFKYQVPQIALLDFVNKNLTTLVDVIKTRWSEEKDCIKMVYSLYIKVDIIDGYQLLIQKGKQRIYQH